MDGCIDLAGSIDRSGGRFDVSDWLRSEVGWVRESRESVY